MRQERGTPSCEVSTFSRGGQLHFIFFSLVHSALIGVQYEYILYGAEDGGGLVRWWVPLYSLTADPAPCYQYATVVTSDIGDLKPVLLV